MISHASMILSMREDSSLGQSAFVFANYLKPAKILRAVAALAASSGAKGVTVNFEASLTCGLALPLSTEDKASANSLRSTIIVDLSIFGPKRRDSFKHWPLRDDTASSPVRSVDVSAKSLPVEITPCFPCPKCSARTVKLHILRLMGNFSVAPAFSGDADGADRPRGFCGGDNSGTASLSSDKLQPMAPC